MDPSEKSFENLGICKRLADVCNKKLNWKIPTEIQIEAIPRVLEGNNDLIVLAHGGSGKTGAFVIPLIHLLLHEPQAYLAFVLAPTSMLAIQISKQFNRFKSKLGVTSVALVEGKSSKDQKLALGEGPHIVVATPSRLSEHLKNIEDFSLSLLKYLVLDEFDLLLQHFEGKMDEILNAIPQERRTYLFSSSMREEVKIPHLVCLNPEKIEAASKDSIVDTLTQQCCFVPAMHKDCYLVHILNVSSGSKSMVFTRTHKDTELLVLMLGNLGFRTITISSETTLATRLKEFKKFKDGRCKVLICTDAFSRGLDIPDVDIVINYNIPQDPMDYIYRVGRTARAGRPGVAISLVNEDEKQMYLKIEKHIGKKLPEYPAEEAQVLLWLDRTTNAKLTKVSKTGGKKKRAGGKKKRKKGGDDDKEEGDRFVSSKSVKSNNKKHKRN